MYHTIKHTNLQGTIYVTKTDSTAMNERSVGERRAVVLKGTTGAKAEREGRTSVSARPRGEELTQTAPGRTVGSPHGQPAPTLRGDAYSSDVCIRVDCQSIILLISR